MAGIYLHIPFCKSRCIYCGFYSTTALPRRQDYTDALCAEMQLRRHYLRERVHSIYIGGGTPSMLEHRQLRQLFTALAENFGPLDDVGEVTMECNPDDVTPSLAALLSTLPVNRVSMGAQTFSDRRLAFLCRRHRAADVGQALRRLRQAGIHNISIDLMYGFPGETLHDWHTDIDAALALEPEHISAYALQYELSRQMYYDLCQRLEDAGYEHYEISNFARPSFRSRHNSSYWQQVPYLGLGAAAHSYDGTSRQWNVSDIDQYIQDIRNIYPPLGRICNPTPLNIRIFNPSFPHCKCSYSDDDIDQDIQDIAQRLPVAERETLDDDTLYDELVMTRLRTVEGLPLELLSPTRRRYCLRQAQRYLADGLLVITSDDRLRLSRRGIFVSDMIMADLMQG